MGGHPRLPVCASSSATTSGLPSAKPSTSQRSNFTSLPTVVRHISDEGRHIFKLGSACDQPRRGGLLVDTGVCVSVCRPNTFQSPVDPAKKASLYSVDDTELKCQGSTWPMLLLGGKSAKGCSRLSGRTRDNGRHIVRKPSSRCWRHCGVWTGVLPGVARRDTRGLQAARQSVCHVLRGARPGLNQGGCRGAREA